MNKFKGEITNVVSEKLLSIVEVTVGDIIFKSIILNNDLKSSYLNIGNNVAVLFKETEVIIAAEKLERISLQNKLECEITNIEKGKLLSQLELKHPIGKLNSIITSKSVERLKLNVGEKVFALIKTNEIMLSK